MSKTYEKVGNKLKVTTTLTQTSDATYDTAFLVTQKADIVAAKAAYNAARDAEIVDIDELIAKAVWYGLPMP